MGQFRGHLAIAFGDRVQRGLDGGGGSTRHSDPLPENAKQLLIFIDFTADSTVYLVLRMNWEAVLPPFFVERGVL